MNQFSNLTESRPNFVTHLECGLTGEIYPKEQVHGLSKAGRPLLVRYDLKKISESVSKETIANRPSDFWRYREFLPVKHASNIVSLGEVVTPVLGMPKIQAGRGTLYVKDEARLPTGSFKARGLCMAISMAKELGIKKVAMPTNGNAGAACSAYASRAGIESYIFCPEDTPKINVREIAQQGGKVWLVNGLINDCGKIVGEGKQSKGWFDMSTLKEPYRIEGKKTMGLELAEQFQWQMPDVILYPTGGGTGLIGMWKAFKELQEIGWIKGKLPRMVVVQSSGCAPIVKAWEEGKEHAEVWQGAKTIAWGIRVPVAVGDFLMIRAVRESGGFATMVDDEAILGARKECAEKEGFLMCPEGAATFAAYQKELKSGRIGKDESVVMFNCAAGTKYELPEVTRQLDRTKLIPYGEL